MLTIIAGVLGALALVALLVCFIGAYAVIWVCNQGEYE